MKTAYLLFGCVFLLSLVTNSAAPSFIQKFIDCVDFAPYCETMEVPAKGAGLCAELATQLTCAKRCQLCTPTS
ncbi:hypothetical protein BsWGS_07770 [Bradybaena similaris]